MPGRITLSASYDELQQAFPEVALPDKYQPRYNIAPQDPIGVISNANPNTLDHMIWGLIPSWEKGLKMTTFLANARSETIDSKPAFRAAFSRRRCLIPADGYYEWIKVRGVRAKKAYHVHMKDRRSFAFAGIWESWQSIDGSEVISCATITCAPNPLVAQIHHRMGVILEPKNYQQWLSKELFDPKSLLPLLAPFPAEKMSFVQVSDQVRDMQNNSPDLIDPLGEIDTI